MTHEKGDWRELCEAAARETDSEKLLELIQKLTKALDERAALESAARPPALTRSPRSSDAT